MATRCDPGQAVEIVRGIWTSPADPAIPPQRRAMAPGQTTLRHGYTMDRLLIDACRPYAWIDEFPKVNSFPDALKQQMEQKWDL
jgi:4-hydroxy-3-polyprenylbenzoate decarboxylase